MSELKVLVVTQKIDEDDDILGFFCGWLNELAKKTEKIYVLALEKKKADLAKNIELYSLGKENSNNILSRFFKFNRILISLCLNKKIDIIFIHMCPEYVFLTFPYAKIAGIPLVMWYAHGHTNMKLKMAHRFVDRIITPSKESFRIKSNKVIITGHGIDVNKFNLPSANTFDGLSSETLLKGDKIKNNGEKIILSVGRISPIKNYETLIKAANILVNQKNIRELKVQIVGGIPLRQQKRYLYFLKNMIRRYKLEEYVRFVGPIPYTQIQNYYQNCDLFVSTSNTGSLDKAVLEAMSCGKIVLTCNEVYSDLLKIYSRILLFGKNNPESLVEKIICILEMQEDRKAIIYNHLRRIVLEKHNIDIFTDRLVDIFNQINNEN